MSNATTWFTVVSIYVLRASLPSPSFLAISADDNGDENGGRPARNAALARASEHSVAGGLRESLLVIRSRRRSRNPPAVARPEVCREGLIY